MGGNRYIGLQLVNVLVEQGHEVTVLNSHEAPLPAGPSYIAGELAEYIEAQQMILK